MAADNKMHLWINFIASFKVSLGNCIKYFAIIVILLDNCWSSGSGKCWSEKTFNFLLFLLLSEKCEKLKSFHHLSHFLSPAFHTFWKRKVIKWKSESKRWKDRRQMNLSALGVKFNNFSFLKWQNLFLDLKFIIFKAN